MGKIQSTLGPIRGSVGNLTFKRNTNAGFANSTLGGARNVNESIVMQKVTEVNNPKTAGQAQQRMRTVAAQNFYRGFQKLLNHSWENVKYRGRSYAYFLSLAMRQDFAYVQKGTTFFVPGEFPMSRGTAQPVTVAGVYGQNTGDGDRSQVVIVNLKAAGGTPNAQTTFGAWSKVMIAQNPQLSDGDQLTFVFVLQDKTTGQFIPIYREIILDTASTDLATEQAGFLTNNFGWNDLQISNLPTGELRVRIAGYDNSYNVVAGNVIHSQYLGDNRWNRSDSNLVLSDTAKVSLLSQERFAEAIASYQNNAGNTIPSSLWYLNQGHNQAINGQIATRYLYNGTDKNTYAYLVLNSTDDNGNLTTYVFTTDGTKNGYLIDANFLEPYTIKASEIDNFDTKFAGTVQWSEAYNEQDADGGNAKPSPIVPDDETVEPDEDPV